MYAKAICTTFFKQESKDSNLLTSDKKQLYFKDSEIKINQLLNVDNGHIKVEIESDKEGKRREGFIYYKHWSLTNWIDLDKLKKVFPYVTKDKIEVYELYLNYAMLKFGINTKSRQAMFLAQIYHESLGLKYWEELASGVAYEGRKDLGNINKGDGVKYKGRSPIQLTGRLNYREFGKKLGIKLEENPELAKEPKTGFLIACLFWSVRGLNLVADKDTIDNFKRVTRIINGGYNGLEDRINQWERIKKIIYV